jgi:hypothetical protein
LNISFSHSRFQPLAARRLLPLSTEGASRRILALVAGQAERRLGVADKLAAVIADLRNPLLVIRRAILGLTQF